MAKTKALISFAVTAKLICVFVFAYAKNRFSHDAAQMYSYIAKSVSNNHLGSSTNQCYIQNSVEPCYKEAEVYLKPVGFGVIC